MNLIFWRMTVTRWLRAERRVQVSGCRWWHSFLCRPQTDLAFLLIPEILSLNWHQLPNINCVEVVNCSQFCSVFTKKKSALYLRGRCGKSARAPEMPYSHGGDPFFSDRGLLLRLVMQSAHGFLVLGVACGCCRCTRRSLVCILLDLLE